MLLCNNNKTFYGVDAVCTLDTIRLEVDIKGFNCHICI